MSLQACISFEEYWYQISFGAHWHPLYGQLKNLKYNILCYIILILWWKTSLKQHKFTWKQSFKTLRFYFPYFKHISYEIHQDWCLKLKNMNNLPMWWEVFFFKCIIWNKKMYLVSMFYLLSENKTHDFAVQLSFLK